MTSGMSLGLWKASSLSSALVDSALAGNHDEAWSSVTWLSLPPNAQPTPAITIHKPATIHFVTGLVSFPAICLCMGQVQQIAPTGVIGVYPEFDRCCRIVTEVVETGRTAQP
jgi:hypothetical protein